MQLKILTSPSILNDILVFYVGQYEVIKVFQEMASHWEIILDFYVYTWDF